MIESDRAKQAATFEAEIGIQQGHRTEWLHTTVNGVLFQCCWFMALLQGWVAALPFLAIMFGHYLYTSVEAVRDLKIPATVFSIGILLDSGFKTSGIFQFSPADSVLVFIGIPLWLCVVWIAFSLTLNRSLSWLINKPRWFVIVCSVAGPMSYLAGRSFEVVQFSNSALLFLAMAWFAVSLLVLYLRVRV